MSFAIVLSPEAEEDIDYGFDYYNKLSDGLGFEFTDTIDRYLKKISEWPTASSIRYDNVRVKPIDTFPYTIHFIIADPSTVYILRIFNTWQQPIW
jgi:hypothetical protein